MDALLNQLNVDVNVKFNIRLVSMWMSTPYGKIMIVYSKPPSKTPSVWIIYCVIQMSYISKYALFMT